MKRVIITFGVICVSFLSYADEKNLEDTPLPTPKTIEQKYSESLISPLTPDIIKQLKEKANKVDKALASPTITYIPRISSLTVDLSTGASLPVIRVATNYASSLTFIDNTGAPWKMSAPPTNSNQIDFVVTPIEKSPIITIQANKPYKNGNLIVYLEGLSIPVIVNMLSGEPDTKDSKWIFDARLDLRLPIRNPTNTTEVRNISAQKIGIHNNLLQSLLDGIPPKDAKELKFNGDIQDIKIWSIGDDLYIRSRAIIRDEFEQTLSSSDGMNLWKLPLTPYVTFSVAGKTIPVNINLE